MSSIVTYVTEVEDRVARGATILDKKRPGWVDLIDLGKLDLASNRQCVLGQVFGSFDLGSREVDVPNIDDYGFCDCPEHDGVGGVAKGETLRAWDRLVNSRRAVCRERRGA
jgi:hypothetical protein